MSQRESAQLLGGTLRLSKNPTRSYERLKYLQNSILAFGILSLDYDLSSKTSKLLQKMMIFGNLETKVCILDQIIYMIKELMIEQVEECHLQMLIQQLVSCIKLWHHTEIHKLRLSSNILAAQLNSVQFINIKSSKSSNRAKKGGRNEGLDEGSNISIYTFLV